MQIKGKILGKKIITVNICEYSEIHDISRGKNFKKERDRKIERERDRKRDRER